MQRTIKFLENHPGIARVSIDYDEEDALYPARI